MDKNCTIILTNKRIFNKIQLARATMRVTFLPLHLWCYCYCWASSIFFFLVSFTYATGQLPSSQSWLFYLFQLLFYGYLGVISDGQIVGFVSIMWETGIGFLAPSFNCCPAPVTAGIWKVNPWIGICVFSFSWVIHEWLKIKKMLSSVSREGNSHTLLL